MTKMQQSIRKYVNQTFVSGSVQLMPISDDRIKIDDPQGETMTLTMNFFGDIMDADTRKIYAISDLPHDLNWSGILMPQNWRDVDHA